MTATELNEIQTTLDKALVTHRITESSIVLHDGEYIVYKFKCKKK